MKCFCSQHPEEERRQCGMNPAGCTGPLEAMEPLPELYSIFQGEVRRAFWAALCEFVLMIYQGLAQGRFG